MAENMEHKLDVLRSKALVVSEKYRVLSAEYAEARQEISSLRAQLLSRDEELQKLRLQVEYLSIASTVRLTAEDLASTKKLVADLVHEIDQCIIDIQEQ